VYFARLVTTTNDWIQRITYIFLWVYIKGEKKTGEVSALFIILILKIYFRSMRNNPNALLCFWTSLVSKNLKILRDCNKKKDFCSTFWDQNIYGNQNIFIFSATTEVEMTSLEEVLFYKTRCFMMQYLARFYSIIFWVSTKLVILIIYKNCE
jgi:hypothetical protein